MYGEDFNNIGNDDKNIEKLKEYYKLLEKLNGIYEFNKRYPPPDYTSAS